jgi:CMP-N,N'-diacetyllegionaminic acid synthase
MSNPKILVIIPARSGSKGIKHKNIKDFNGLPLLVWSIKQAQSSKYNKCMRIFLSTDSNEYSRIGKKYGAEVPILRPKEISQDSSTDYEFILHAIEYYASIDYHPDMILHLRPTQPCRKVRDIDNCIKLFNDNKEYSSLRTVVKLDKTPYKMYRIQNKTLTPLFNEVNGIKEPFNQARQILPQCYLHNGYIDIVKPSVLLTGCLSGNNILPYVMNSTDTIDIDTISDWSKALTASHEDFSS